MTLFKQRVKQDFSAASSEYDRFATLQYQVALELCQRVLADYQQQEVTTILDLGCGTGYIAALCEKVGIKAKVLQIDLSFNMCMLAGENAINADMELLPFKEKCFDVVLSSMALQWAEFPEKVFSEVARVLKPGGAWHIAIPGKNTLRELRDVYESCGFAPPIYAFDEIYWDQPEFRNVESESVENIVHYPSLIMLLKSIKKVGARHKSIMQPITPRQLKHLDHYYRQHYGDESGIMATWDIHFMNGHV